MRRLTKQLQQKAGRTIIILAAIMMLAIQSIPLIASAALSPAQLQALSEGILYFNTDTCSSQASTSGASGSLTSGQSIYILGDSITDRTASTYQSMFQAKGITANIDGSDSRSLTATGVTGNGLSGLQAISADTTQIQQASAIVVALGTNGGNNDATVKQAIAEIRMANTSAPIYWIDTIVVGRPSYDATIQQANAAIYGQAPTQNYQVISWFKTVDPSGNPQQLNGSETDTNGYIDTSDGYNVHPTIPKGVNALASLVLSSTITGSNSTSTSSSNNSCACGSSSSSSASTSVSASAYQVQNAETIMGIAKTENLGQGGALIALMVGIDESTLTNDANQNVPLSEQNPNKQGDGNNGTSLGVFQQQIADDWSTISSNINDVNAINQLMTPAYSAEAFFGSPAGSNAPPALTKGLQNIAGWQSQSPWLAAQAVQQSGDKSGSNYEAAMPQAQSMLNQYWSSSTPVALPVALTNAGPAAGSTGCSAVNCSAASSLMAGDTSQLRQNIVCLATQELNLWKSGQLKPGTNAYFKYSQNRPEEWCADFASWIYIQAGDPLQSARSGNVSYVPDIQQIGEAGGNFSYHSVSSGYTPQPGDLAIHGSQHVNIVISAQGSSITLIGGDQGGNSYPTNIVSEYTISSPASDPVPITGYVSPN